MINYGFSKEADIPLERVLEIATEALKKEGFSVLTKIDLSEKFKEKLGVDFKKYVILETCNPQSAYKAVVAEENIGLFLPCNVLIYEKGNKTVVTISKPTVAMAMIENDELNQIAREVETKLKRAFDSIK